MQRRIGRAILALTLIVLPPTAAVAQNASTTSSISGTVSSADAQPIANAAITLTNDQNRRTLAIQSNATGEFSAPSLESGTYTVSIGHAGFKTTVMQGVTIRPAWPAELRVVLALGSVSETIDVRASSDLIQTQANTVSVTLTSDQIKTLPFLTRNVLYALTTLSGVDTNGSPRGSLINGLPQQAVNITFDGVSVRDNFGVNGNEFFGLIEPTFDAVEHATVTTAVPSADSAGQGSATVRFVTRAGTSVQRGSAYGYFRHPSLNSREFFRELNDQPKDRVTVYQLGGSQGGPLRIGGAPADTPRAFFFVNYEQFRQRLMTTTRTRTVLNASATQGMYRYNALVGGVPTVQTVDLLHIGGLTSAIDPTVGALLAEIQAATASTGTVTPTNDLNTSRYEFQSDGKVYNHFATARVDYDLSPAHRLTGSYHWQQYNKVPDVQLAEDPTFPGLPVKGSYRSLRQAGSLQLRSIFGPNLVHELGAGFHRNPIRQTADVTTASFANQQGFDLMFPLGATGATPRNNQDFRQTPNWNVDSTLTWLAGRHSVSLGGTFTRIRQINEAGAFVPTVAFGIVPVVDPADAALSPANFPGASAADVLGARALFAFLTGRVSAINATAALDDAAGSYVYNGKTRHDFRMTEIGLFAEDRWRIRPGLTANFGLRWEVQLPVVPLIGSYSVATIEDLCGVSGQGAGLGGRGCNLFMPGTLAGQKPRFLRLEEGAGRYNTDVNNVAPNVGIAWQPQVERGWLRRLLGDPATATFRAGYGVSYNRNTMNGFQSVFTLNPGRSTSAARSVGNGNLVLPGESWPLLLSEPARLGPPATCTTVVTAACLPASPTFPIVSTSATNMSVYDPDIQLSSSRSFSIGFQRALGRDTAVEVRYVGTRTIGSWVTENWNEFNVIENGFLDEFKQAQANLYANIAAERGTSFAYFGPGTGTSPLPILLAHFSAVPPAQADDAARYTDPSWRNGAIALLFNRLNPNPFGFFRLYTDPGLRANSLAAGLPVNFWVMNPDVANGIVTRNGGNSRYDALQIDVRRRMSRGLLFTANYTRARTQSQGFEGLHKPYTLETDVTVVPSAFKLTASYEVPVSASARGWSAMLASGWTTSLSARVQSGQRLRLGGVKLVGMTEDELSQAFRIREERAARAVYTLPQDIIDNTIRAFSSNINGYTNGAPTGRYLAPASGPDCIEIFFGDCGEPRRLVVSGPVFTRFDLNVRKRIASGRDKSVDVQVDIFNVFAAVNFVPVFQASATPTINQTTSSYTDLANTYDPGGRVGQIALRFNW